MTTHAITERAMTVTLSVGTWLGYRLDKDATKRVTSEAGAAADAARVNKHLIPKEALAPIVTAQGAIRTHFYAKTLPWRDNGDRLIPRMLYLDFIPEHERLVTEFNTEVDKFLDERYPSAIGQAEFRMGDMFNRDDYPPVGELRRKFYVSLEIDAISTASDFRVQMDQAHVDKVKASIEAAAERRIHAAMRDVWIRLAKVTEAVVERLDTPDAIFRDSLFTNITELVEMLPGLNVLDDPSIEEMRRLLATRLGNVDPKDVRKDPEFRQELAGEAKEVLERMRGFMNAFGASAA